VSSPVIVLLPGLHGTTELFDRFVAAAPADITLRAQPLPNELPLNYDALTDWVIARLPPDPVVLIAESFSGPVALLVADRCPRVIALALCATFVEPPAPSVIARIPRRIWNVTPPLALIRALLTGGDRALAADIQRTVRALSGDIIAHRIASALHVNVKAELQRCSKALLCLSATRDWIVPARSAATIRALKPSATFVEIDGPHMLLQTRAAESWRAIEPFIQSARERLER
jgi:pimeloyl-[acyl-carrier protein] methyl ester esterase